MVEATRNFSMNRNFDGFDEKVENPCSEIEKAKAIAKVKANAISF